MTLKSQSCLFASLLFLLAASNVLQSVNDPFMLFESLSYDDLFPQGVRNKTLVSDDDVHDNGSQNVASALGHQVAASVMTRNNNASSTIASALDHIVLRFRRDPTSVQLQPHSIPVLLWPYQDKAYKTMPSPDMVHIQKNGVDESSVLYMAPNAVKTLNPNVVWLADVKVPTKEWCKRLTEKAKLTVSRRKKANLPLQWPIFVVDFTDQRTYHRCKGLEKTVGVDFVIYSKRSVVVNRVFDKDTEWVSLGTKELVRGNVTYEHTPLIVRTDIVVILQKILQVHYQNAKLSDPIEKLWNRSVDIAHYWPSDGKTGIGRFQNELRNTVSRALEKHLSASYSVFAGVTGIANYQGRRKPQTKYVQHMLNTKIVVVAQRDEWEGHYRLYEALLSGAMVMSDQMLISERLGLENGTSVVEYDSPSSLVSLARFYLEHDEERQEIARKGRSVAMSRHRSWHRMEEIILGQIVTECGGDVDCPYTLHAANRESSDVVVVDDADE